MKKSTALRMTAISGFGFELINLGTTVAQIYHERTMHLAQVRLVFSVAGGILVYFSADETPRPKPKPAPRDAQPRSDARALIGAFESGAFGGLLGGIVAGCPLALYYYFSALAPAPLLEAIGSIAEIVVYGIAVGLIIGLLVQLSIYASRKYLNQRHRAPKDLAAGLVGGIAAGLLGGLIGGGNFALRDPEPISFGWLMGWLAFGVAWIAAGSLLLEHDWNWRSGLRALSIVFGAAILAGGGGFLLLEIAGIDLYKTKGTEMALGVGAEIGVICGAVSGLQIAVTQVVYGILYAKDGRERPSAKKRKSQNRKGRAKEVRRRR